MNGIYGKICGYALFNVKDNKDSNKVIKRVRVCILNDYENSFGTLASDNIVIDADKFIAGSEKDILNKTVFLTGSEFNGTFYAKSCKEL